MDLGKIIKEYREKHNLTMQEFANRCKLSKGYISMLEKGAHPRSGNKITPSIDTIARIATGMRITTDELVIQLDDNQKISLSPSPQNQEDFYRKIYENGRELFDAVMDATPDQMRQAINYINWLKELERTKKK